MKRRVGLYMAPRPLYKWLRDMKNVCKISVKQILQRPRGIPHDQGPANCACEYTTQRVSEFVAVTHVDQY